jgi:xylan 1,4-beta-xylosidase
MKKTALTFVAFVLVTIPACRGSEPNGIVTGRPALPEIKPLFDYPLRDVSICLAPDGMYYMTGTTGYPRWWKTNSGIEMWKSSDLKKWDPMGQVWSIERDGTWQKTFVQERRAVWAPEVHYIRGTFWLAYSMPRKGCGLLKSVSGKAQGPYVDVKPSGPLSDSNQIDASLFVDDDDIVYYLFQDGKIARLNANMNDLAEKPRLLKCADNAHVGYEGVFLFKRNGRYYLSCAEFSNGKKYYDCMAACSDHLFGPYGDRYLAIPHGGHNMFFKDKEGQWWSTMFGHDNFGPVHERPAILKIEFDKNDRIKPRN